jgi:hypothetical protein
MRSPRIPALAVSAFVLAACNPFHRDPMVEVSRDANLGTRWRASLTSPAALGGAVQMNGGATMEPGRNGDGTDLSIAIANATPGGVHPWQVRRGQCGADEGVFGSADAYKALKVDDDGRAGTGATVPITTPTTGNYFVRVSASAVNSETVVACGNLAPPAR